MCRLKQRHNKKYHICKLFCKKKMRMSDFSDILMNQKSALKHSMFNNADFFDLKIYSVSSGVYVINKIVFHTIPEEPFYFLKIIF